MPRTAFGFTVLATLGASGLFALMVLIMQFQPGFMGMAHFTEHHHRVHDLTFSFLLGTAIVGLLAQLRAPLRNVAGQLMALIPFVSLTLIVAVTNTAVLSIPWMVVGAFTLLATTLHPAGRGLLKSFNLSRVDRAMLGLLAIAAIPLLAWAATNIGLQRSAADDHAALGHYGFLAAFSLTVIGVGLLASLRLDGWRLAAWVAGVLLALAGLASLVFADVASSLETVWALAAIAWGISFVAAAELSDRRQPKATGQSVGPSISVTADAGSAPILGYLPGVIVIAVVLVFVVMHFTGGGGPGLHTPPAGGH